MSSNQVSELDTPYRPAAIGIANRIGKLLSGIGIGGHDLSVQGVLAQARRKTGLSNFGDAGFMEPLSVLLDSVNREASLNPVGQLIIRARIVGILENKLAAEEAIRNHPEILDIPVPAPIVIAGLARTGTTMLHRLIAQDPRLRSLTSWEALNPAPSKRRVWHKKDPRVARAALAAKGLEYMSPGFFAIHPAEADAPEEEVILLEQSFMTTTPEAMMHVPTYARWLEAQNHVPAYRALKRMLQYLHWQRPGVGKSTRWVLKTPHHQEFFDPLLEVFPDAVIVHTHRDPLKTSASLFSMLTHLRGIFSDDVDPNEVARHWLRKIEVMAERAMATRARVHDRGFVDVSYYDLIEDPLAEVERIYGAAGMVLTSESRKLMEASRKVNPQHKYGRHTYALQDFGISKDAIESSFANYRARFEVPFE